MHRGCPAHELTAGTARCLDFSRQSRVRPAIGYLLSERETQPFYARVPASTSVLPYSLHGVLCESSSFVDSKHGARPRACSAPAERIRARVLCADARTLPVTTHMLQAC